MDTRFLETFVLVVELGSQAEAARQQGLTPAAVALRVKALEDELGAPILFRSGRMLLPTEAGFAILEESRAILVNARRLKSLARTERLAGELRLGAISTAQTGMLPRALRHFRDALPEVEVFVQPGTSSSLYNKLQGGRIDAAILIKPPFPLPKSLEWRLLRSEPMILLCPTELAHVAPLSLLRTQPFIRYDSHNWGGRLAVTWLQGSGVKVKESFELDSLEAIAVMVSNGIGVSVVPDWAPPWPEGLSVARLPLPAPTVSRELGMLWPRSSPAGRLARHLLEALGGIRA